MRTDAALKNFVAVIQQMMCGNRCCRRSRGAGNIVSCVFGRDVLEDHFQLWHIATQRLHDAINEYCFAIKNINRCIRHLTVHQERHFQLLQHFQRLVALA